MADETAFAYELAHDETLQEADIVAACAWFLSERSQEKSAPLAAVCDFIEGHGIRVNINRSRLRGKGKMRTGVFLSKDGNISFSLRERSVLRVRYSRFLEIQKPAVEDTILELRDFASDRTYRRSLAEQVNLSRQFGILDGCAVLMRRLMEVLIIDAFEDGGRRDFIMSGGEYLQLGALIGVLTNGQHFKLSRNAKRWAERCKEIGDNAAHSRTYLTKRLDIDEFSGNYRVLVAELVALRPNGAVNSDSRAAAAPKVDPPV